MQHIFLFKEGTVIQSPEGLKFQCARSLCFQEFKILEFQKSRLCFKSLWQYKIPGISTLSVYRISCFSCAKADRLTFMKDWKVASNTNLQHVPQERYRGVGPGGSFPPLLIRFQAMRMRRWDWQSAQKDGEGPSQLHGARSKKLCPGHQILPLHFWEINCVEIWAPRDSKFSGYGCHEGRDCFYLGGGYITYNLPPVKGGLNSLWGNLLGTFLLFVFPVSQFSQLSFQLSLSW